MAERASAAAQHPVTPDGRYFVVRGRLWRMADPSLHEARRAQLVRQLMSARRQVGKAKRAQDAVREAEARAAVDLATIVALFVRFWLVNNPPLPDAALAAAQAMGKERWERFVETLNRRMEFGPRLKNEISEDIQG